ncbi:peptidase C39 [Bifidobacterium sp. DSM 109958]|uniref:Peptidase C39 n=1 Tax=Bifidobacterium moraviense TaxID=2675323 RepID=A0A7Y0F164_9BIFI|nr:peptidase C39 [Bifidobacterium sp. DSM 109958]NMN00121.1 peptidase C39 [Bifidobacterium sp. DSM 109958]
MRIPLIYQMTRYDCGPTTLVNALRFLYEREEIDPELVRAVYARTLDDFSEDGELGKMGTSHQAMRHVARYLNVYARGAAFPVETRILSGADARLAPDSAVYRALASNGTAKNRRPRAAAIARVWHGANGHYILLTGVEDGRVLAFDPFLEDADGGAVDGTVIREVRDLPLAANRSVDVRAFNRDVRADYALKSSRNADPSDPEGGELILIRRTDR